MTTKTIEQSLPLNRVGDTRGMSPKARAAIQPPPNPIKPGETRNPKGYSVVRRALAKLEDGEECPYDAKGRPWSEVLPEDLLRHAHLKTEGMRTLLDRIEGPVDKGSGVNIDNRTLNIYVKDVETKELLERAKERTRKQIADGNSDQDDML